MKKIFIYDDIHNTFEVFFLNDSEYVPYSNTLTLKEFSPTSDLCWTTKQAMSSYDSIYPYIKDATLISAFHRIYEKGYTNLSSHLAGIAFDFKFNTYEEHLKAFREIANTELFNYQSEPDETPTYMHIEKGFLKATCDTITFPLLKINDINPYVCILQDALITLNYLNPNYITGFFDEQTKRSLQAFQTEFGLISDGIAGCKTWSAMVYIIKNGNR